MPCWRHLCTHAAQKRWPHGSASGSHIAQRQMAHSSSLADAALAPPPLAPASCFALFFFFLLFFLPAPGAGALAAGATAAAAAGAAAAAAAAAGGLGTHFSLCPPFQCSFWHAWEQYQASKQRLQHFLAPSFPQFSQSITASQPNRRVWVLAQRLLALLLILDYSLRSYWHLPHAKAHSIMAWAWYACSQDFCATKRVLRSKLTTSTGQPAPFLSKSF